ncbi:MAG: DUF1622 domain-containing protein [Pseudomonadota bacterium]
MTFVHHVAEYLADIIDLMVIVLLGAWTLVIAVSSARSYIGGKELEKIIYDVRVNLGRLILLGLELLIISDVLHSIASRTLEDLGILGAVVVIRVFMAYFLDKELERLTAKAEN